MWSGQDRHTLSSGLLFKDQDQRLQQTEPDILCTDIDTYQVLRSEDPLKIHNLFYDPSN